MDERLTGLSWSTKTPATLLLSQAACGGAMNSQTSPQFTENPSPRRACRLTIRNEGAPWPLEVVSSATQYDVVNQECLPPPKENPDGYASPVHAPRLIDAALDALQMSWRPGPEVARVLAAGLRDPALRTAQHDPHASPMEQAWRERVEAHRRDLAAHERAPDFKAEQPMPEPMDIAP